MTTSVRKYPKVLQTCPKIGGYEAREHAGHDQTKTQRKEGKGKKERITIFMEGTPRGKWGQGWMSVEIGVRQSEENEGGRSQPRGGEESPLPRWKMSTYQRKKTKKNRQMRNGQPAHMGH